VIDNVFVVVNDQGNVYAFNNEIQLIGQSTLKISDVSIVKFSESKKLMGIGSQVDRNVAIFDIGLIQTLQGYD
jgi:WD40 repeat protein